MTVHLAETDRNMRARLDTALDKLVASGVTRNPAVRIETAQGELVYEAARGAARADRPGAMRPDHRFHLASIAKTMTAALVLQLMEQGMLGRDGLESRLAEFEIFESALFAKLHRQGASPLAHAITIRHLLTHTAGIRDAMIDDAGTIGSSGPAPNSLVGRMYGPGGDLKKMWRPWDPQRPLDPNAGVINLYFANGLGDAALWPPGTAFHYSDTGFMILGLLIEKLTGKSYGRVLEENVFNPLGLRNTYLAYFNDPVDVDTVRSLESDVWNGTRACMSEGVSLSFDWAGGGVVSTAPDLAAFFRALREGRYFKQGDTIELIKSWIVPDNLLAPRSGVGLGVFRMNHGGIHTWGHAGAWGAKMFQDLETGFVLTGTLNAARTGSHWEADLLRAVPKPA